MGLVGKLTEIQDLPFGLQWPPRWYAGEMPRPLFVYLDHWCWDHIVQDRAGRRRGMPDEGIFEFLREKAHAGEIVIPLSQAHYQENWVRENADARWDTAVAMAKLTGFTTMSPKALVEWEASLAVAAYFSLDTKFAEPQVFGWGHLHCIFGKEVGAFVMDTRTGKRANWDLLEQNQQMHLQHLEEEAAYRVELAALALREPSLEGGTHMSVPRPVPGIVGAQFRDDQIKIGQAINAHGRTAEVVRNTIEMLSFVDSTPFLYRAATSLGQSWVYAMVKLAEEPPRARMATIHKVLGAMPIQGTFTELRVRAHLKEAFRWEPSDCMDFFAIAQIMPFVDVVVVDRRTHNLMNEAAFDYRHNVLVLRKLADLRAEVDRR